MQNDDPDEYPGSFWLLLRQLLAVVRSDFVTPLALALSAIPRSLRAQILAWLQPYEHAARAQLIADALALNIPFDRPPQRTPGKPRPSKPIAPPDMTDSAAWRVSFPVFRAMFYWVHPGPKQTRRRDADATLGLARRIEMLLRLTDQHEACAARLAKRLWRYERRLYPHAAVVRARWMHPAQFTARAAHERLQAAIRARIPAAFPNTS